MRSGEDVAKNLATAEALVRDAARAGASFVTLPDGEGFAIAVLDFDRLHRLRAELPALRARKV